MEEKIIHTMGINNCGGRCIIDAHVKDGEIVKITTDKTTGDILTPPLTACPKGFYYHKTYLNKETRLQSPLIRTGKRGSGEFREATWEEAIQYITKEWIRIRDTYGVASRYVHYGWGVSAVVTPLDLVKRLLALDGGYLDYYNSYSNACLHYTSPYVYGTKYTGNSLRELCNSKLILLWGHNPADTKFDTTMFYLSEAKKRNIPIVCIDPRYHQTAKLLEADWYGIRPTTDAALADAMAYVIITKNLYDEKFIKTYCQGFTKDTMPKGYEEEESYFSYVLGERDHTPKTPEWGEKITGVCAKRIEELAILYASTKPAALLQGYGPQRNLNGEQSVRGILMLACLTGNVGISGGWSGGGSTVVNPPIPEMPEVKNPFPGKIPVYRWTDAVVSGKSLTQQDGLRNVESLPSNIKMIFNFAGNALINQHGDINRTSKILEDESMVECIVVSDLFMTPSAKYADVLLPSLSFLETNNMTSPWVNGDFIGFNNRVVEPFKNCRFEYDWLKEIAKKLDLYEEFTQGHETVDDWLIDCYEKCKEKVDITIEELPCYEEAKKAGIYRYKNWPNQIAFQSQIEDFEHHPFETPSGKIEIFSPALFDMNNPLIPGIPKYLEPKEGVNDKKKEDYPIQLIGYHTKRRCHSIHDQNQEMEFLDPQMIHIAEQDARVRDIKENDLVEIKNDRGTILMKAHVSSEIMPGVAAISQGAWFQKDYKGRDVRGCINTITSLESTPLAHGNGQHTNLVEIRLADKDE